MFKSVFQCTWNEYRNDANDAERLVLYVTINLRLQIREDP